MHSAWEKYRQLPPATSLQHTGCDHGPNPAGDTEPLTHLSHVRPLSSCFRDTHHSHPNGWKLKFPLAAVADTTGQSLPTVVGCLTPGSGTLSSHTNSPSNWHWALAPLTQNRNWDYSDSPLREDLTRRQGRQGWPAAGLCQMCAALFYIWPVPFLYLFLSVCSSHFFFLNNFFIVPQPFPGMFLCFMFLLFLPFLSVTKGGLALFKAVPEVS